MLSERDAIKRESSILMSSAMADERLSSALMNVEQLTVELSQQQHSHQQQVRLGGGCNHDLTPIRLQFDRATTIRRPTLRP